MTHDELRQEADTPIVQEETLPTEGPSHVDAPPATRRRTRRRTGSVAASTSEPASETSLTATNNENSENIKGSTPQDTEKIETAEEPATKASSTKRRTRQRKKNTEAPAAASPADVTAEVAPVDEALSDVGATSSGATTAEVVRLPEAPQAEPSSTEQPKPASKPRRTSRRKQAEVVPESPPLSPSTDSQESVGPTGESPLETPSLEIVSQTPPPQEELPTAEEASTTAPVALPSLSPKQPEAPETVETKTTRRGTKRSVSKTTDTGTTYPRERSPRTTRRRPEPTPILPETTPATEFPPIDIAVGAHIVERDGMPVILINGWAYPPTIFFGNLSEERCEAKVLQEIRQAAKSGIHLHSTLIELPCPLSEASEILEIIDSRLRSILEADPEGFVMPRLVFYPAPGWRREYPLEMSTYADGTTGDPSITSQRFWQECERSLQTLIEHLRLQPWGERVFGYHLERGEWFQPADLGFDRSMANRDAFRDWLRERYQGSLIALRAAWFDGDVQFHTAEIPALPTKPDPMRAFFETRRERHLIDFMEFTSETTARRIISLARAVKRATAYRALVSVCYGYTFEFTHGYSGHLALDRLLAERCIDLICGPPSYRDRKPGGAASFPAPVDSMWLHGKLWLSEDDTKTHLALPNKTPDDFNPRLTDARQTEQAQLRTIGRALVHRTAVGWMDLWGEGWLDDEAIWKRLKLFASIVSAPGIPRKDPEVVVLIDEKSLLHIQRGEGFFRRFTIEMRDVVQRCGVEYGLYLQSDVTSPNFPTDGKLYIFLNPFRLTTEQRAAIREKLHSGKKTLVWLYAPGTCEAKPRASSGMEETAFDVVGLRLRLQPWSSEMGSRVVQTSHPITERLTDLEFGYRERLNPSFYVDDPDAIVLAEYIETGLPSVAVKQLGDWKSVFIGETVLPLELLRGICRFAGVHLWVSEGEHIVEAGSGWIVLHATQDGRCVLRLPAPTALYDLAQCRLLSQETAEYALHLRQGTTYLFLAASYHQMERIGLPHLDEPVQSTASPPLLPAELPKTDLDPSVVAEALETLQAVLAPTREELGLDPETPVANGTEEGPADTGEPLSAGRRRRRRRGGRGRGKQQNGTTERNNANNNHPSKDNHE
ncbi:hypothetical protein CWRG_00072 [Chthonomonas calidirosea]|uniref:hypothetical protein n=1 Tax=Chthonomonas calidirosea TaxID=454171 RepID=UPI0006DD48BD|nr:hypothetical protein [Chthonomonas calidirosea]CEK12528.1 hypothetical protein CWRG_00072 [Chthonomonas calidirosea]